MRRIVLISLVVLSACNTPIRQRSDQVLGTFVTISVYRWRVPAVVWEESFAYLHDIEARMSTSEDYQRTELLDLHEAAGKRAVQLSADTYSLLDRAQRISAATNGSFNVAVLPLVRLWNVASAQPVVPSDADIAAALPLLDFRKLVLSPPSQAFLEEEGMGVDLGGIAKGYAAEQVGAILEARGIECALVDLGGNIYVLGEKPDGSPWTIGIRDPRGSRTELLGTVELKDGYSMVTSGPYERYFEQDGLRYHHIFDTRNGYPAESDLESVTVVSKDGSLADALSTSFFVAGGPRARMFAMYFDEIDYILVYRDSSVEVSPNLVNDFSLVSRDYFLKEQ